MSGPPANTKPSGLTDLDDHVLQDLYAWVDQIPLSRPKRNISRDFSDGVLMAELVKYYFPKLVEVHNFPTANAGSQKKKNWHLLNWKVFKKLNFELSADVIESLVVARPGTVERVLLLLRTKIDRTLQDHAKQDALNSSHRSTASDSLSPSAAALAGGNITANAKVLNASLTGNNVPRLMYEEKVQECLAKDETIEILQAKVRKLEHLLQLKDIRIEDLQAKLETLRPTGPAMGPTRSPGGAIMTGPTLQQPPFQFATPSMHIQRRSQPSMPMPMQMQNSRLPPVPPNAAAQAYSPAGPSFAIPASMPMGMPPQGTVGN